MHILLLWNGLKHLQRHPKSPAAITDLMAMPNAPLEGNIAH